MTPLQLLFSMASVAASYALCVWFIPIIINAVQRFGLLDTPNERSAHKQAKATLGGIAIVSGIVLAAAGIALYGGGFPGLSLLLGAGMLLLVGIVDDVRGMRASVKLLFQLLAAAVVVVSGESGLVAGLTAMLPLPPAVATAAVVFLLAAAVNAFNLMDGIDGLAGGLALTASLALGGLFWWLGADGLSMLALSIAAACVGFLRFNAFPSRIFMGDAGSMPLGFLLAGLCLLVPEAAANAPAGVLSDRLLIPMVAVFTLPGLDMIRTMVIRMRLGRSPFAADNNHLHHRLLQRDLHHGQVAAALVGLQLVILGLAAGLYAVGVSAIAGLSVLLTTAIALMHLSPAVAAALMSTSPTSAMPSKAR